MISQTYCLFMGGFLLGMSAMGIIIILFRGRVNKIPTGNFHSKLVYDKPKVTPPPRSLGGMYQHPELANGSFKTIPDYINGQIENLKRSLQHPVNDKKEAEILLEQAEQSIKDLTTHIEQLETELKKIK